MILQRAQDVRDDRRRQRLRLVLCGRARPALERRRRCTCSPGARAATSRSSTRALCAPGAFAVTAGADGDGARRAGPGPRRLVPRRRLDRLDGDRGLGRGRRRRSRSRSPREARPSCCRPGLVDDGRPRGHGHGPRERRRRGRHDGGAAASGEGAQLAPRVHAGAAAKVSAPEAPGGAGSPSATPAPSASAPASPGATGQATPARGWAAGKTFTYPPHVAPGRQVHGVGARERRRRWARRRSLQR